MLAALAGLFLWSFAAATVLPLSSEVPLGYLVRERQQLVVPVLVATVGNYLGACTTYWMARAAGNVVEKRRARVREPSERQLRALAFIRRWGAPALFLSWVPVLGDALVVAAGGLRVPFGAASLWIAVGKLARYLVVATVALSV
jgi:membrane protein YqaA with SNARE-associated domain